MEKLIILLVFNGIGIIRSLADNAAKKRQREQIGKMANMQKDQRQKVQSEIEAFLQGVTGGEAQAKKPEAARQQRPRRQAHSEQRRERSEQRTERRRQRAERQAAAEAAAAREARHREELRERHVRSTIGDHVDTYMHVRDESDARQADVVAAEVVAEAPSDDIWSDSRDSGPQRSTVAEDILTLLRTPQGIRQAIIANEVLQRPRSLRR